MRILCIVVFAVFALADSALATQDREDSVRSYKDYVEIKHISARRGLGNREPIRLMRAEALTIEAIGTNEVFATNRTIQNLYADAAAFSGQELPAYLVPDGNYWVIEISYRGKVLRLESGDVVNDPKYAAYQQGWSGLYERAYDFITDKLKGRVSAVIDR